MTESTMETLSTNLVARHNSRLQSWLSDDKMKPYAVKYLSPSSQNEFINLLAEDVENRIVKDVVSAEMYSVMADTSPSRTIKRNNCSFCDKSTIFTRSYLLI